MGMNYEASNTSAVVHHELMSEQLLASLHSQIPMTCRLREDYY